MLFKAQIKFLDDLEETIFNQLESSINQNGFFIEEKITDDQLFKKGEDGKGKKLLGYSRTTIRIKIAKGQPVDRTTLLDEDKFHPSIEIRGFPDRFEVSSNVTHATFLIKRYGEDILRPSNENLLEFLDKHFFPNLKKTINVKFTK